MALVLRKAVLPKNASFLKCLKGRPLATASNKKNTAPISKAATLRPMREQPQKVVQECQLIAFRSMTQQKEHFKNQCLLRKSFSCPSLSRNNDFVTAMLSRTRSTTVIDKKCVSKHQFQFLRWFYRPQRAYSSYASSALTPLNVPNELREACSVCACPPSDCCNLPPPCNQPAKCLQAITGYYYYPYGTWFCGPYHVKTGPCGPCAGPVQPGGPRGPAPPNPGGSCGPAGVVLCGPGASCAQCRCAPCPTCAPCGPCGSCGACGCYGPCSCRPCGPCGLCYDPYSPCGLPGACAPCASCGYSICNGPCGPCYNIPCKPIQVCGPIRPGGQCGPAVTSNPLDLCAKCCLYPSDTDLDYSPFQSISSSEASENSPEEQRRTPVSAPARMNIYPSLANSKNIYEPISQLHQSAMAAANQMQIRYFSIARVKSKKTDVLTSLKENGIVKAKLSTFSRCCSPWGSCLCNTNMGRSLCPPLCKPRYIPTKEERDQPYIPPNCFCYSNTPPYKNPSPYTDVLEAVHRRPWSYPTQI